MDLKTATPTEIDTRIAEIHNKISVVRHQLEIMQNRVFHWAGRREYIKATWTNRKSGYKNHGTYDEALEIVREMWRQDQAWRAADYADSARPDVRDPNRHLPFEGPDSVINEVTARTKELENLWAEAAPLNREYAERRWSRFFLVVSSTGHIHSGTHCHTCRPTTAYGWLPEMSGQTEAEAIKALGTRADALCSVCFPDAPVAAVRSKITKAQAAKAAAATFVEK